MFAVVGLQYVRPRKLAENYQLGGVWAVSVFRSVSGFRENRSRADPIGDSVIFVTLRRAGRNWHRAIEAQKNTTPKSGAVRIIENLGRKSRKTLKPRNHLNRANTSLRQASQPCNILKIASRGVAEIAAHQFRAA